MKTDFLKPLATAKFWKELVIMTLGMLVGAAAVYYFLMPSKLIIGSISGFSIVLSEIFAKFGMTVRVSVIIAAINAVLLVLAWLLIGAEFGAKTVYTALILGPLVDFWAWVLPFEKLVTDGTSIMNDPWLDLICFVLMLSISQAILFRINASTGGLDILAKIVNKYLHFDIGTWINGIAVDYFTDTLNKRKRVCIISDDHEAIREFIIKELERGCSIYKLQGGFSGEETVEVVTLLTQNEYAALFNFLKTSGFEAFITAGNVSEIYGNWHKKEPHPTSRQ